MLTEKAYEESEPGYLTHDLFVRLRSKFPGLQIRWSRTHLWVDEVSVPHDRCWRHPESVVILLEQCLGLFQEPLPVTVQPHFIPARVTSIAYAKDITELSG